MIRIVAVTLTLVSLCTVSYSYAECSKADRAELQAFDQTWGKATTSGDRATLEQVLADDYVGFGATLTSKAQAIANAIRTAEQARMNQAAGDFREDYYQITCTPTTATIVHRNVSTTGSGADERVTYGRSIHVVEKRGGKWQVVSSTGHALNDQAILGYMQLEWNDASRSRDVAWFERNFAAEFTAVRPSGEVRTKADVLAAIRADKRALESLELSELTIRVVGDTAVVAGVNHVKGKNADGTAIDDRARFTDTLVKRNGRWLALSSHVTPLPRKTGT